VDKMDCQISDVAGNVDLDCWHHSSSDSVCYFLFCHLHFYMKIFRRGFCTIVQSRLKYIKRRTGRC
jgi:hypothetical protein